MVTMIATVRTNLLLQRYVQFVKILYTEPNDQIIIGSYLLKTNLSVFQENDEVCTKKKKRNTKDEVKSRDIVTW